MTLVPPNPRRLGGTGESEIAKRHLEQNSHANSCGAAAVKDARRKGLPSGDSYMILQPFTMKNIQNELDELSHLSPRTLSTAKPPLMCTSALFLTARGGYYLAH